MQSKIAVFAFCLNEDGMVMSVTRPLDKRRGAYSNILFGLPGGKVDEDEDWYAALRRECLEEGWDIETCQIGNYFYEEDFEDYTCLWFHVEGTPTALRAHKELHRMVYPVWMYPEHLSGLGNDNAYIAYIERTNKCRN